VDTTRAIELNCLCGCPAAAHPAKAVLIVGDDGEQHLVGRRVGCGVLGPQGLPHCYGYVSPEDSIDA